MEFTLINLKINLNKFVLGVIFNIKENCLFKNILHRRVANEITLILIEDNEKPTGTLCEMIICLLSS